jgi:hypothetical protein
MSLTSAAKLSPMKFNLRSARRKRISPRTVGWNAPRQSRFFLVIFRRTRPDDDDRKIAGQVSNHTRQGVRRPPMIENCRFGGAFRRPKSDELFAFDAKSSQTRLDSPSRRFRGRGPGERFFPIPAGFEPLPPGELVFPILSFRSRPCFKRSRLSANCTAFR